MPVAEVRPSLEYQQTCEVRVWLESHDSRDFRRSAPSKSVGQPGPSSGRGLILSQTIQLEHAVRYLIVGGQCS